MLVRDLLKYLEAIPPEAEVLVSQDTYNFFKLGRFLYSEDIGVRLIAEKPK